MDAPHRGIHNAQTKRELSWQPATTSSPLASAWANRSSAMLRLAARQGLSPLNP
jgi:hypothetical protein